DRDAVLEHENDAEVHADRNGAREQASHFRRGRGGRDVVVVGGAPEQEIADATAREQGFVAGAAQARDDTLGSRARALGLPAHAFAARIRHAAMLARDPDRGNFAWVARPRRTGAGAASISDD